MKTQDIKILDKIKIPNINVEIPPVLKKKWTQLAMISVASFAIGYIRHGRPSVSTSTVTETVSFTTTSTTATVLSGRK